MERPTADATEERTASGRRSRRPRRQDHVRGERGIEHGGYGTRRPRNDARVRRRGASRAPASWRTTMRHARHRDHRRAPMRTLITNGIVVNADGSYPGRRPRRRGDDRGGRPRRWRVAGAPAWRLLKPSTASSTPPAGSSSRAASTRTRTWSCPSAARSPRTPSRRAPARPPSAARRRSSTSPSRRRARPCDRASRPGWPRPRATAPSTTAST